MMVGQSTQIVGTDGHSDDLSCSIIGFTITAKTHLYIQLFQSGLVFLQAYRPSFLFGAVRTRPEWQKMQRLSLS